MNGRVHTREFKLAIARQLASGEKRLAQICREHNLASSVVSRWRNEYEQRGEEAFLPPSSSEGPSAEARIAELERFCGQLALENTLLKKPSYRISPNDELIQRTLKQPVWPFLERSEMRQMSSVREELLEQKAPALAAAYQEGVASA